MTEGEPLRIAVPNAQYGGPQQIKGDETATQTIYLDSLPSENLTESGSFDFTLVRATPFGKLLLALPIPALLINQSLEIVFANAQANSIEALARAPLGSPVTSLVTNFHEATKIHAITKEVFSTRKPLVSRAVLGDEKSKIWGRLHFRSIRMGGERFVLVLIEDLTAEMRELLSNKRQQEELEKRVEERTNKLREINRLLNVEIAERKRAEAEREELIAALMETREKLQFEATHDSLTGLWNRAAILDTLRKELSRAGREGTRLGVVVADIDHFKRVNDRLGHLTGDAVLREVAQRMALAMRPYDTVGRYGGEEFVLILPGVNREKAWSIAERLRLLCEAIPVAIEGAVLDITMSFGIAAIDGAESWDVDATLKAADDALLHAKSAGRNCVVLWAPNGA